MPLLSYTVYIYTVYTKLAGEYDKVQALTQANLEAKSIAVLGCNRWFKAHMPSGSAHCQDVIQHWTTRIIVSSCIINLLSNSFLSCVQVMTCQRSLGLDNFTTFVHECNST